MKLREALGPKWKIAHLLEPRTQESCDIGQNGNLLLASDEITNFRGMEV